jgi:signal transduction histidine kinase
LRLVLAAALWIAIALLLTGAALLFLFTANIERSVQEDLDSSFNRLIALLDVDTMPPDLNGTLVDPRYDMPFSGRYWQIRPLQGEAALRSRSLWDHELALPLTQNSDGLVVLPGPSGQSLAALVRVVSFDTGSGERKFQIVVATDRAAIDRSIGQFRWDMTMALAAVGAALIVAALVLIHFGLTPLAQVRTALQKVRVGQASELPGSYPQEVMPLVSEVNSLLKGQEAAIEFARHRAADLAHGLKTPLSVLSATAQKLHRAGDTQNGATLTRIGEEMSERIDYQLRLAGLRPRLTHQALSASLNQALLRTVAVLRKTPRGEEIFWAMNLPVDVFVDIDNHDLMELVGIVLENAVAWAGSCVEVTTVREGEQVRIEIRDDGPGLTQAQIDAIGARGKRLDETRSGTGLGLSIAKEILVINSGSLKIEALSPHGLLVCICLPLSSGQFSERAMA